MRSGMPFEGPRGRMLDFDDVGGERWVHDM